MSERWDRSVRECSLETVLDMLYAHEINAGLSSFWDGGWDAWIGDDMNGKLAEANFRPQQLIDVPAWLADNAERLYPALLTVDA